MNRRTLIQRVLDKKGSGNYLEIGVRRGRTFLPVRARKKIAVDPEFMISVRDRVLWSVKNPWNLRAEYFEMESDEFFSENASLLARYRLDVVLVDGLHLFEQSLRDVLNSLAVLNEGGVVVMHDCNPLAEPDATRAESAEKAVEANQRHPAWSGAWNGDVWKAIVYIRRHLPELSVFVLDCDHGLGVIQGSLPAGHTESRDAIEQIRSLPFSSLENDRGRLLNLKCVDYVTEFLESLASPC
jgi:hypothetical protein